MATKLKNLKVSKVDFVDEGANPEAHIQLFKSKDGKPEGENIDDIPKSDNVLKRFIAEIGKKLGFNQDEIQEITKGDSITFGEKMYEVTRRKITDEIWDLCWALQSSLCSIITDDELESGKTGELMQQSVNEFATTMASAISEWSAGNTMNIAKSLSEPEIHKDYLLLARDKINILIEKSADPINNDVEGEVEEMKIDKSKLTSAEKAFLEDIEKRAGEETTEVPPTEEPVTKGSQSQATGPAEGQPTATLPEVDDIYKGLHPAIAAELKSLRKRADDAEEKELTDIAKKYEIIGKKPEELVPVLKSLKATGDDAYNSMITILDASVEAVNKSSMFSEIGKSGGNGGSESDSWAKVEKKAEEIMKSNPTMNRAAAIDLAFQQDPQLVHEYENEE